MSLFRQLHHHHCSQTCCLRTQTTASEIYRNKTCIDSLTHLLDREVTLRTNQHQCIVTLLLSQMVEEVHTGNLIIAMGDIARPVRMGSNKLLEGQQRPQSSQDAAISAAYARRRRN